MDVCEGSGGKGWYLSEERWGMMCARGGVREVGYTFRSGSGSVENSLKPGYGFFGFGSAAHLWNPELNTIKHCEITFFHSCHTEKRKKGKMKKRQCSPKLPRNWNLRIFLQSSTVRLKNVFYIVWRLLYITPGIFEEKDDFILIVKSS